jgi:hypothetical protein
MDGMSRASSNRRSGRGRGVISKLHPARQPVRDESETWQAVARETLQAFDAVFMPAAL